jgi:hypothetical protein
MAVTSNEDHHIFSDEAHRRAREAMHAVADGLTDQGLDILGQEWDEAHYLKATNAWGALCEATIGANGTFTWDYRAAGGPWTDPAQITAMAMILLAADSPEDAPSPLRFPGQTLRSAVGLAARARGLHARLADVIADPEFLEVSAGVEITNPARPERGAVCVRGNVLSWECQLACPDIDATGLDAAQITEAIGRSVPQLRVLNAASHPSNQYPVRPARPVPAWPQSARRAARAARRRTARPG